MSKEFENSSYSVNMRKLARKSRLGFGYEDIKHITIQDILIMNKHKQLISIYFGLDKITFMDDILDELGITEDMRIEKPGKIRDYPARDVMVLVKARRKDEVEAFREMAKVLKAEVAAEAKAEKKKK
mgnify:CR=1 FL=1